MVLKRGSNTGNHAGITGAVPSVFDLAALEDLGPRVRAVIVNAPIKMLAYPILKQIMDRNTVIEKENEQSAKFGGVQRPYLDPMDPQLDDFLAKQLLKFNFDLLLKDRELEFATAGVIPLRPRPSPKSIREQRRAMRGARRWR